MRNAKESAAKRWFLPVVIGILVTAVLGLFVTPWVFTIYFVFAGTVVSELACEIGYFFVCPAIGILVALGAEKIRALTHKKLSRETTVA